MVLALFQYGEEHLSAWSWYPPRLAHITARTLAMKWRLLGLLLRMHLQYYSTPLVIGTLWNLGFFLSVSIIIQCISGLVLASIYSSDTNIILQLLHSLQRGDYSGGWLVRYLHVIGSSLVMGLCLIHMAFKSMVASRLNTHSWLSGLVLFVFYLVTAYLGYVLPWGSMSFWASTVISSLLPAKLQIWWLGNFWVSSLTKVFCVHYFLPLLSIVVIIAHFYFLHAVGSSSSLGYSNPSVPFYATVITQDLAGFATFMLTVTFMLFHWIHANPSNALYPDWASTPLVIDPEWYFLAFYAVLKVVPNLLLGELLVMVFLLTLGLMHISERILVGTNTIQLKYLLFTFLGLMTVGANLPFTLGKLVGLWLLVTYLGYWTQHNMEQL